MINNDIYVVEDVTMNKMKCFFRDWNVCMKNININIECTTMQKLRLN